MNPKINFLCLLITIGVMVFNNPTARADAAWKHNSLFFSDITSEDGLELNNITCIAQGNIGYMWIGTDWGMYRYNGRDLHIFGKYDWAEEPFTLLNRYVNCLHAGMDGYLWVGTQGALSRLNIDENFYDHFVHDPSNPESLSSNNITAIEETNDYLWVGTTNGLNRLHKDSEAVVRYPFLGMEQESIHITGLSVDHIGNLWITTEFHGLHKLSNGTEMIEEVKPSGNDENLFRQHRLLSITTSEKGNVWIGSWGGGLYFYDMKSGQIRTYQHNPENNFTLSNDIVFSVFEDESGIVWIGTWDGLNRFDPTMGSFVVEKHQHDRISSICGNTITSIYQEESGALWFGSKENGACRYDPNLFNFQLLSYNPYNQNSLSSDDVFSICQDGNDRIWIGTKNGILNEFNPDDNSFYHYPIYQDNEENYSVNAISALYPDPSGAVWVGTMRQGLMRFKPESGLFEIVPILKQEDGHSSSSIMEDDIIRVILVSHDGKTWVGTESGNLYKIESVHNNYLYESSIMETPMIRSAIFSIIEDHNHDLWIGTQSDGLIHFNSKTNQFEQYIDNKKLLENAFIISLYEDENNQLWIGTDRGVFQLDITGENKTLSRLNLIFSGYIQSIAGSPNGNIWLSTNKGIIKWDNNSNTSTIYNENDGLQQFKFYNNSAAQTKDGLFLFGGTKGITVFDPLDDKPNSYIPPVVLFDIHVNHVYYPTNKVIHKKFSYHQNNIDFNYASLNYTNPYQNKYQYRLIGMRDEWVDIENRDWIHYNFLPPGKYIFEVKGSNNDGVWNEEPVSIPFEILPPFWETWWFRISIVGFIIVLAYVFFHLRLKGLESLVSLRTVELQRERDYSQSILHSSPSIIIGFSPNGALTFVNPTAQQILGINEKERLGSPWWKIFPTSVNQDLLYEMTDKLAHEELFNHEMTVTTPNQATFTLLWTFVHRKDEENTLQEILAFGLDVTEKMEKEILKISGREQHRIGQEIHDGICQTLTGMTYMCQALVMEEENMTKEQAELAKKICHHFQQVMEHSRSIARGLYLHELEHNGIKKALKELAHTMSEIYSIRCQLHCHTELSIDDMETRVQLYRITQEAVSNATKHSKATCVDIFVESNSDELILTVEDNGKGFSLDGNKNNGMGMAIMMFRAKMIDAVLDIVSSPENGTSVICKVTPNPDQSINHTNSNSHPHTKQERILQREKEETKTTI